MAEDGWASSPQQDLAVERSRAGIRKRTHAALAADLAAWRRSSSDGGADGRAGDDGLVQLEVRRRRGDVDLGPERMYAHRLLLVARGAPWLAVEPPQPEPERDDDATPLKAAATRTCNGPVRVGGDLGVGGCEALLEWLYTGAVAVATTDGLAMAELEALHAVAAARKIAGLTELVAGLLRSSEPDKGKRPASVASGGARGGANTGGGRGRGGVSRGRGRGRSRAGGGRGAPAAAVEDSAVITPAERQLCDDIHGLYTAQVDTDCVIVCTCDDGVEEDRRFCVHRALLSARSEYFRALLSERWQPVDAEQTDAQMQQQELAMSEPPEVIDATLAWIYGSMAPLPAETLPALVQAAEFYGLTGLQSVVALTAKLDHCHLFLHAPCAGGCGEGVPLWLQLADRHSLGPLRTGCVRWLARNYRSAWPTRRFAGLPDELRTAVAEELTSTLTVETATVRYLEAGGALSGGVAAGAAGDWGAEPMRMLSDVQAAALRVITAEFEEVSTTLAFVQLCGGVGWQEHLVVDEIAPSLRETTTRQNRGRRRAAVERLVRAVHQEGLCPAWSVLSHKQSYSPFCMWSSEESVSDGSYVWVCL